MIYDIRVMLDMLYFHFLIESIKADGIFLVSSKTNCYIRLLSVFVSC